MAKSCNSTAPKEKRKEKRVDVANEPRAKAAGKDKKPDKAKASSKASSKVSSKASSSESTLRRAPRPQLPPRKLSNPSPTAPRAPTSRPANPSPPSPRLHVQSPPTSPLPRTGPLPLVVRSTSSLQSPPLSPPPPPYTVFAQPPPSPRQQPQYASLPPHQYASPPPQQYASPPPQPYSSPLSSPAPYPYLQSPLFPAQQYPQWPPKQASTGVSCTDLTKMITRPLQDTLTEINQWQQKGQDAWDQGIGMLGDGIGTGMGALGYGVGSVNGARRDICSLISTKLDRVLTDIDCERFSGDERELVVYPPPDPALRGGWGLSKPNVSKIADNAVAASVTSPKSTNYFAKANLYANSKLPMGLPPLKLYLPSYPLICLAAQFSQTVYTKPTGKEREAHVEADWRHGTKAMVIKSIPIDDMNVVVFAIRGSQTFMDWAVNLNSVPTSPQGFLDDPGNLCHSGFLSVAKKMIKPVAARLRSLLEEDPSRSSCSLIMTGHSAGGAVASLLFTHMLAETARSELNILTGCFKRIHCITFGTPPISLLPLNKPSTPRYQKSLFLSFINEGDPVARADKAYIRSLLDLYASPAPGASCLATALLPAQKCPIITKLKPDFSKLPLRPKLQKANSDPVVSKPSNVSPAPIWPVPPSPLSNAGRLVLLREGPGGDDEVLAQVTSDAQLRGVVFGDPVMHMMRVYARRVEVLATMAVTGRLWT